MARNVVDFISAPNLQQLRDADVDAIPYCDAARPSQDWINGVRGDGRLPLFIYESVSTWSQGGYSAGALTCSAHEAHIKATGHTGSVMVVVSDGSAYDPNYGYENIYECGRGWSDNATMPFFPYGNVYCCNAFIQGADAGAGAHLRMHGIGGGVNAMIPETWGYGDIATQLVGGSPIPGTDLDIVHVPDLSGGVQKPAPAAPDLFTKEVPLGAPRTIFVNGIADTFFVDDDKLWWIHQNPQLPSPHKAVVVSGNADSAHPEIDVVPTGYGPILTLRKKTNPGDPPECMKVVIKGWAYVAETI